MAHPRSSLSSRGRALVGAPAAVLLVVGCSYDWTFKPDDAGGAHGGVGIGTVGDVDASSADGSTIATADASTTDATTPPVPVTTCRTSSECGSGKYCRFADGACGQSKAPGTLGTCAFAEEACTPPNQNTLVCACDGSKLAACTAALKGLDVDMSGRACANPATFACVGVQGGCTVDRQYCLVKKDSQLGQCIDYVNCDVQTACQCQAVVGAGCTCAQPTAGAVTVTCTAP
jgi:hypothetical protein